MNLFNKKIFFKDIYNFGMFSPTIEQHLAFQFTSSPFAPEMAYYFLYFYIAFCCRPLGKPATDWRAIFSAKLLTPAHNTHIYTRPPAHTHLLLWHACDACGVCRKCQAQRPRAGTTMPGINCWHVDVDALPLPHSHSHYHPSSNGRPTPTGKRHPPLLPRLADIFASVITIKLSTAY